jgi:hypothetical protein
VGRWGFGLTEACSEGNLERADQGSGDSRSCSRIALVAEVGAQRRSGSRKRPFGHDADGRHPGSRKSTSLTRRRPKRALATPPLRGAPAPQTRCRDRGCQRQARNSTRRLNRLRGEGRTAEGSRSEPTQVRTALGGSVRRAPLASVPKLEARRQNEVPLDSPPLAERGSHAPRRKRRRGMIRESSDPSGCSCRDVDCRSR